MIKWEYYMLVDTLFGLNGYYLKDGVKIKEEPASLFDHIQYLGNEGWELTVHTYGEAGEHDEYIFKRKIIPNKILIEDTEYGAKWFLGKEKVK